jgi:hypothetical protein
MYEGAYKNYKFYHSKCRICWNFKSCWYIDRGLYIVRARVIRSTCFRVSIYIYDSTTRWPARENWSRWAVRVIAQAFSGSGKCGRGAILLHDGVRPHTALQARKLSAKFSVWKRLGYPSVSPDLATSHFNLFRALKEHLSGYRWRKICQDIVEGTLVRMSLKENLSGYRWRNICQDVVEGKFVRISLKEHLSGYLWRNICQDIVEGKFVRISLKENLSGYRWRNICQDVVEGTFVRMSWKEHLLWYRCSCDEDVKPVAITSLTHQRHTFCMPGTDKHTTLNDKSLNFEGAALKYSVPITSSLCNSRVFCIKI